MERWSYLLLLQLLLHINISFAAPVDSATKDEVETTAQALDYLTQYGYNTCTNTSAMACSVGVSSLLKEFQKFYGLRQTGILDVTTKQLMSKPRCGNPDVQRMSQSNAYLKWSKNSLTWSLRGNPNEFSFEQTESIMKWAFEQWTDHIPIKIKQTCSTCNADIIIDFLSGNHGDGYSFDGPGKTLAHAFFPEDGRIHFDKDEKWNDGFTDDMSLYLVAVHEIGHAIGFDHQYSPQSIMYPTSQAMSSNDVLPSIDRDVAQNVYGYQYPSVLKEGQRLNMTQQLRAPDGNYFLAMQSDGNLVLYKHSSFDSLQAIWASGTNGHGVSPYYAILQFDGNFVVYDGNQDKIWETGTKETQLYTFLQMQDDGNLVLYKGHTTNAPIWATGTHRNSEDTTSTTYIIAKFHEVFPNDTIVAYKYKSGSAEWFYGTKLLDLQLKDDYWLRIIKFSTSVGESMTTDHVQLRATPYILKTKAETDGSKRRDILRDELKTAFPNHFVNVFIYNDNDWTRSSRNAKGTAYYEKNYGTEVDIVLT
ncbi:unnamed protein product [Adineta ricciae]|uniref:Bulb-type lectin domain-containing protein n=1 Tax=Adineta ricciae TaxID=249248 RepID=A0A815TI13_ADIRI|nr:unnamed protein product [Adineta ricciae]CAF1585805.1 unnamed protein product [Adineta ricciae]